MPQIKRWFPVSHSFNRDPEIQELRTRYGDWMGYIWQEFCSIADRNDGAVQGTIPQIARSTRYISMWTRQGLAEKKIVEAINFMADCAWIAVRIDDQWVSNAGRTKLERLANDRRTSLQQLSNDLPTNCIFVVNYAKYHRLRELTRLPPDLPDLPDHNKDTKEEDTSRSRQPPTEGKLLKPPRAPKEKKPKALPPAQAIAAAQLLSDKITENFPGRTAPTEAELMNWSYEADLIHRIDGHQWEAIMDLLGWSQTDSFWKSNILSMGKFREKWNQLLARKEVANNGRNQGPSHSEPKGFDGIRNFLRSEGKR